MKYAIRESEPDLKQKRAKRALLLNKGDYVLATKYSDGDPGDQWCVGFYDGRLHSVDPDRHFVVDEDGKQFRGNGFRRVAIISRERGEFILRNRDTIEWGGRSLWWWKRCKMSET